MFVSLCFILPNVLWQQDIMHMSLSKLDLVLAPLGIIRSVGYVTRIACFSSYHLQAAIYLSWNIYCNSLLQLRSRLPSVWGFTLLYTFAREVVY